MTDRQVIRFDEVGIKDVPAVGGKNASLGEMVKAITACGVRVPGGFAITAEANAEQQQDKLSLGGRLGVQFAF